MATLTHPAGIEPVDNDLPERSAGAARAIGAIGAMLGALGVVTAPFIALRFSSGTQPNVFISGSPQAKWIVLSSLLSTGLSAYLIIASVATLGLRRWSRVGMIVYAVAALVVAAIFTYPYLRWMGIIGEPTAAQRGVSAFLNLFGWMASIIYAILVLAYMTRRSVRQAYETMKPEAP